MTMAQGHASLTETPRTTTIIDRTTDTVHTTDLIHWGPVIAGIFAALATLITLAVLGLAVGLRSFDPGDPAGAFALGAGIWSAVSALIAFFVGGWLAGRSAAERGTSSGIMHGAMVWFVAIPLLVYMLGSGLGALAQTAGSVTNSALQASGQVVGQASTDPAMQATAQAAAQQAVPAAQATVQSLQATVTNPQNIERTANSASNTAWGTLFSLGLAALASIMGGYLGAKPRMVLAPTARKTA